MSIWKHEFTLDSLNMFSQKTLAVQIGIEFTGFDENSLTARMPVDYRTHQPMGILHGGASAALAVTLGSVGAWLTLDDHTRQAAVGLNINTDHLRQVTSGFVTGVAKPIKLGHKVQLWTIEVLNSKNQLISLSKLTMMIIQQRGANEFLIP